MNFSDAAEAITGIRKTIMEQSNNFFIEVFFNCYYFLIDYNYPYFFRELEAQADEFCVNLQGLVPLLSY